MKICPKCKRTYQDEYQFCTVCGCNLENKKTHKWHNKRNMLIGMIVVSIAIVCTGFTISEQKKISDTRKMVENRKNEKALEEYRNTPTKSDLKVNNDWTTEKSGSYIYIKGSVTNVSRSKTIRYFEVEAKFCDNSGNVIDSDWTNDSEELELGETRKFEIMHKYSKDEKDICLSVKEVK